MNGPKVVTVNGAADHYYITIEPKIGGISYNYHTTFYVFIVARKDSYVVVVDTIVVFTIFITTTIHANINNTQDSITPSS